MPSPPTQGLNTDRCIHWELKQQSWQRLQKCRLKSEVTLLQTLLHLFCFIQFVKSWQFFLESNSKSLFQSSQKENKVGALCSCPPKN